MSDPKGHVSDPTVENSLLNQSSTDDEFADILSDTFEAWLDDLKPRVEPDKNLVPAGLEFRLQADFLLLNDETA